MMRRKMLFCTVGGSHEPLLTAYQTICPDQTFFICSRDAPGSESSEPMITGKGSVIKANRKDQKPTLPNIPTQLGIAQEHYSVVLVDPDDIDDIVLNVDRCMKQVAQEDQGGRALCRLHRRHEIHDHRPGSGGLGEQRRIALGPGGAQQSGAGL